MLKEHHLPRCVEFLVGGRSPVRSPSPDCIPDRVDDPAAAIEGLAKVDLSDDPTATAKTSSKPRQAASSTGGDVVFWPAGTTPQHILTQSATMEASQHTEQGQSQLVGQDGSHQLPNFIRHVCSGADCQGREPLSGSSSPTSGR